MADYSGVDGSNASQENQKMRVPPQPGAAASAVVTTASTYVMWPSMSDPSDPLTFYVLDMF